MFSLFLFLSLSLSISLSLYIYIYMYMYLSLSLYIYIYICTLYTYNVTATINHTSNIYTCMCTDTYAYTCGATVSGGRARSWNTTSLNTQHYHLSCVGDSVRSKSASWIVGLGSLGLVVSAYGQSTNWWSWISGLWRSQTLYFQGWNSWIQKGSPGKLDSEILGLWILSTFGKLKLSCDVIVVNHFSHPGIVFEWAQIKQQSPDSFQSPVCGQAAKKESCLALMQNK